MAFKILKILVLLENKKLFHSNISLKSIVYDSLLNNYFLVDYIYFED